MASTSASIAAAALGIDDLDDLSDDDVARIQQAHLLLAMYNALQPGVFALSGWLMDIPFGDIAQVCEDALSSVADSPELRRVIRWLRKTAPWAISTDGLIASEMDVAPQRVVHFFVMVAPRQQVASSILLIHQRSPGQKRPCPASSSALHDSESVRRATSKMFIQPAS